MTATSHRALFFAALLMSFAPFGLSQSDVAIDSDHDGLSDTFEQSLLDKFQPTVMISTTDCATKPARFKRDDKTPEIEAVDGTIYGQVSPVSPGRVEVHYFTLWDRDCGRNPHPLDVEHVSVLIATDGPQPKALYWYAGAHEKTVCDISSGAHAIAVGAEDHGPQVWSSSGKHALYFTKAKCDSGSGCGADSCINNSELARNAAVINVGERHAPSNGSTWVDSPAWTLHDKMGSDFSAETIALVDAAPADSVVTVRGRSTFRGTVQVSDTVLGSATNASQHTGAALDSADTHTSNSLQKATDATGRSLKRAWNAVFGKTTKPADEPAGH